MEIILFIQSFRNPFFDYLFQLITMFGEQSFFIILACCLTWCYDKENGWRIGFIFLTGSALNGVLKDIFCIQRPIGRDNIISQRTHTATGYSFPSGHTQGAALCWGSLMKIYRNRLLIISGTAIIILVGVSRLYLGVHWPSDVIGGALIGIAWVFAADFAWRKFKIAESLTAMITVICIMVLLSIFFSDVYIIRTTGATAGLLSGIYLEKKYLNYNIQKSILNSVVKMVCGIAVIAVIMLGMKRIAPATPIFKGITFLLVGFWITYGAPCFFKLVKGGTD